MRHCRAGRLTEGERLLRMVLTADPRHADSLHCLGLIAHQGRRFGDAVELIGRAIRLRKGNADYHNDLGNALMAQGDYEMAVAQFERALTLNSDHVDARNNLGNVLKDEGDFDDAMAHYDRAIALRPDNVEAHFNRAAIKTFHRGDPDLAALEALAAMNAVPEDKTVYVHFALAKALEDIGDHVRAFEHLHKGNALKRRQIVYDETRFLRIFRRISSVYDRKLFDRFRGEGDPSPVPVFVLGMPRSGSTLIAQVLASHPQIHGAGERADLDTVARSMSTTGTLPVQHPECVSILDGAALKRLGQAYLARLPALADGKVRIVDKTPGNFLYIGLIRLILPNARIIHSMRDPLDTCVSCYSKLFASAFYFSYDLAELGRFYRCYSELMTHWRSVLPSGAMLDVAYEDMVDDLEGQARRLIDYCGLPWDDCCLDFHRSNRRVKTASSAQVRQPLFRSSLQRWRKYQADLAPLLQALGNITQGLSAGQAGGTMDAR